MFIRAALLFIPALALACGQSPRNNPMQKGGGNTTSDAGPITEDAGKADSGSNDAGGSGNTSCRPERLIIMGDSIMACTGVGDKDGPRCGPKVLHEHLKTKVAHVTYENIAVPGAVTNGAATEQLANARGGPDPVLVVIYVGGNDLSPYMLGADSRAENAYTSLKPQVAEHWRNIFTHFNDATKFPGGVKIIMNTQYNPFDDCTASPYNITPKKFELLSMFNQDLSDLAAMHDNVFISDQHGPFLGHGHHYDVSNCPNYSAGNDYWMLGGFDLVHPNALGHASIAAIWIDQADTMYTDCP
jgi:lysophospholipase L1-like esterase